MIRSEVLALSGMELAARPTLAGTDRSPQVLVLVLSRRLARIFEVHGPELVEAHEGGFPLEVTAPHEWDTPHRDLPVHEEVALEERRFVYRAVDHALDGLGLTERSSIVLVGPRRELAAFEEVSHHRPLVIGRVSGSYVKARPHEIARVVVPVVDSWLAARDDRVVHALLGDAGAGRAVTGPEAVGAAAREGRGHRLIVEEGYGSSRSGADGPEDAADACVRAVLASGGEVEFVAAGKLAAAGGIGLVLRY